MWEEICYTGFENDMALEKKPLKWNLIEWIYVVLMMGKLFFLYKLSTKAKIKIVKKFFSIHF